MDLDDFGEYDMMNKAYRNRLSDSTPTSLYVRIMAPSHGLVRTAHPKQLTIDIIKFGIAYCLMTRDCGYSTDNGYMAFSFECATRNEARIVENIMRNAFADLTVLSSFEYLDVRGLATRLGHEHVDASYDNYVSLARKLFVYMVETTKIVFPGKYLGRYGMVHKFGELDGERITASGAIEFGFRTPSICWTPISAETPETMPEQLPKANAEIATIKRCKKAKAVAFSDVEQLALNACGATEARHLQEASRVSMHDRAALSLYHATQSWMVDPRKVDEAFYNNFAISDNETYRKARRFTSLVQHGLHEIQADMTAKLASITSSKGNGLDRYISRVNDNYSVLIIGVQFLGLCLQPGQLEQLKQLKTVTVAAHILREAFETLKNSMAKSRLSQVFRLFDLKESCSDLIALKKTMGIAFNMKVARQSPKNDCRGFKLVDISPVEWQNIRDTYGSRLFAFDSVL